MPDVAKRVHGPAVLTAAAATKYTVPGSTVATLRDIDVCNEDAVDPHFVTLSIGVDGAGKRLFRRAEVAPNGILQWTGFQVMQAGEVIQAFADVIDALTLTISVVETT